eukprot:INCI2674.1.p1 GENE.INCI2674.1~~INCI2674.1.p1  ORF type:complete len:692 (-),score=114.20 INCI2674.1:239-2314(-)
MSLLDKKIERVLAMKTDSPEMHNAMAALSTFYGSKGNTLEARRSLRVDLEGRSLSLAQDFVAQFSEFQNSLEAVEETVKDMKSKCAALYDEIDSTEKATATFLQRTKDLNSVRDTQKKSMESLRSFIMKFKLSDAEIQTLLDAPLSRTSLKKFLDTLSQLEDMKHHCSKLLAMSPNNTFIVPASEGTAQGEHNFDHTPMEIFNAVSQFYEQGYARLFQWLSSECAQCFDNPRPSVDRALLEAFHKFSSQPTYLHHIEDVVVAARSHAVAEAFSSALNEGGPNGVPPRMEDQSATPVRFVNDLLAWCHQAIAGEKELYSSMFDQSHATEAKTVSPGVNIPNSPDSDPPRSPRFAAIFEGLATVVGRRLDRVLKEFSVHDVVSAFRLWKLFGFYAEMTRDLLRLSRRTRMPKKMASDGAEASSEQPGASAQNVSPMDPLSDALFEAERHARITFMGLARQRGDAMLDNIATAPASLSVSSVVQSSLGDLKQILDQEAGSLTSSSSYNNSESSEARAGNSSGTVGSSRDFDVVLDLFLHPMLRTSLRSAKSLDTTHTALFMVNNAHAMRLALLPYPFAQKWVERVTHERDSWQQLLVVELAGSVIAQCNLTDFLKQCRSITHEPQQSGSEEPSSSAQQNLPLLASHTDATTLQRQMKQFYNALFSLTVPILQHVVDLSLRGETQQVSLAVVKLC